MAKELNKSKTEQKLTWTYLALTSQPTWWPTGPAQRGPARHRYSPPLSSSSCQWEQLRARTRAAEEATSSLPGCLLLPWSLPRRHAAPTPSHFSLALWTSLPLAPLFPLPRPNGAAATDESHRGYRPPHGSPTPQEAPPVLPLPPQRATRPRTCHNTALDAFFNLGTAGHLRQIRRLRTVPDLAERPLVIAVSH